jgi:hypothetical protein
VAIKRIIEVGPVPTLSNMAKRTLSSAGTRGVKCQFIKGDAEDIAYLLEDKGPDAKTVAEEVYAQQQADEQQAAAAAQATQQPQAMKTETTVTVPAVQAVQAVQAAPARPALPAASSHVDDVSVTPLETLRVMLSLKLK